MAKRPVLPPVYFLVALIATVLMWLLLPEWRVSSWLVRGVGGGLLAAGLAMNVVADKAFARHGTTVKPFEESAALVTTGIFGWSRNPMYVGIVLMLAGASLLLGSFVALVPAVLLVIVLDRRFIQVEEKMLAEKFGDAWTTYRASTRRWL